MVSGLGENPIDVALYVMASKEAQLQSVVNLKILKTAMETQEAIVNDLLESIGNGAYIDAYV